MSHIDRGPLSTYNSLTDNHLNGFFSNTRMRRHLKKAGLITRYGEIVSENTYRLNMSRKEHKKHVKDMLAQAIVHKTLDLERSRQAEIKKKLEEIAKIELVRRVRSERHRHFDDAILPYLSPRRMKSPSKTTPKLPATSENVPRKGSAGPRKRSRGLKRSMSHSQERATRQKKRDDDVLPYISPRSGSPRAGSTSSSKKSPKRRPMSTPARKGRRPMSALSSNYEDDDEEVVVYLDDEGRPITPAHVDDSEIRYSSKDPIDTRHLYALDTSALRKYAMLMARMEQGRGATSPYLIPQVPIPPKSPHSGRSPRSAHRYRTSVEGSKSSSPKRPATAGQAYLHPAGSPKKHMGQPESMCEVVLRYHGSSLSLAREQFDRRQDIVVEQQHCGGNTLTVFKDKLEPDTKFSFISYRHRGYPFSLTIYIDGKMDCRVSTCCEDRHKKGGRIGGKHGHFSFLRINGAKPCYKCQVEKGVRIGNQAPKRKLKRPPPQMEEVVVVETKQEPQREVEDKEDEESREEILVPVEDEEDKDKYDDDFDSSSSSSSSDSEKDEDYAYNDLYAKERGTDEEGGASARPWQQTSAVLQEADVRTRQTKQEARGARAKTKQSEKKKEVKKKKMEREKSESESESSCDSDESYYGYKARMMKKDEKSSRREDDKSGGDSSAGTFFKAKNSDARQTSSIREGSAKKKSVASSSEVRSENKVKVTKKKQTGEGAGDTADEVSDIESEMAASSPRKSEGALLQFHPKEARGIDQTTGKADINDVSESESDQEGKQQSKKGKKKKKSRSRSSSSSSSSSSSDREDTYEARKSAVPPPLPASPPAQEVKDDSKKSQRDARAKMEDKNAMFASYRFACADDEEVPEETDEIAKTEVKAKRKDSVTSTSSGSSKSSHDSSDDYSDSEIEISTKKSATVENEKQDDQRAEEAPVTRSDQAVPQVVIAEVDDDEKVESREITGSHVGEEQEVYSGPVGGTIAVIEEEEDEDKEERKEEESNVEDKKKEEEEEKEERSVTVGVIASSNVEEVQKEEATTTVQSDQAPEQAEAPASTAVVLPESPPRSVEAASPEEIPPPPDAGAPLTPEPETKNAKKPDYSSSSSSDSDSSSDDSSSSDDDNTEKKGKVETQAMVHQTDPKEAASQKISESDAETKDGGNDPDNVTSENTGVAQVKVFAEVGESKPLDGSILPLLEASQTTLEVKGVTLNKTQVYEVAQYLESAKEIRFFNLVNCGIDDDDVQKITEAMKVSASSPVLVNLSINPLSAGCVPHLLEMLKAKPCIEAIVLQGTRLGDDGVSQLVDGLLALHQERKMAAMEGEEKEKELNELDLSDAKFGNEGVASIARLIRSDMDIDTLTLSHNHAVNTSGWCTLGEALSHNTKLETLTLDHNFIEDSGLEAIAQGLYNNTTLTALDLNNVNITKASSKTLLEMLKRNTTILEITMAGNKIPESDVDNIQRYIALNKSYN